MKNDYKFVQALLLLLFALVVVVLILQVRRVHMMHQTSVQAATTEVAETNSTFVGLVVEYKPETNAVQTTSSPDRVSVVVTGLSPVISQ